MPCVEYPDGLTVCSGGLTEVIASESAGERWCFVCRQRVEFTDTCTAYTEPSYYDPWWTRKCPRGHVDGDLFPGWSRWAE